MILQKGVPSEPSSLSARMSFTAAASLRLLSCGPKREEDEYKKKKANEFYGTKKNDQKISCWVSRLVSHPLCVYFV